LRQVGALPGLLFGGGDQLVRLVEVGGVPVEQAPALASPGPLVTRSARRCWMRRRPPDAVIGLGIPRIEEDVRGRR
jgi:hypothetical protein